MTGHMYQQLSEPFPDGVEKMLKKGGASLVYIPVSEVITRLNKVIGVDKWDSVIISCERDAIDPDFIVAHVRLTANIDGTNVIKDGVGGQKIKRTKNGDIVDLGDEMKGAVSDALKKAAQQFGVGLYLARSEEALDLDEQEQAQASRNPEIVALWEKFLSVSRGLDADGKKELANRWDEYSDGAPKPNIDSAKAEDLDFLIGEAQSILEGEAEPEPQQDDASLYDKFIDIRGMLDDDQVAELREYWQTWSGGRPVPKPSEFTDEELEVLITECTRIYFGGEYTVSADG